MQGQFSLEGAGFQTDFTNDYSQNYSGVGFLDFDDKGEVKGEEEVQKKQEPTKEEGTDSCTPT